MVQSSNMVAFGLSETVDSFFEMLAPMWVELLFMVFFSLGFALIPRARLGKKGKKAENEKSLRLHKQIGADVEHGDNEAALKTWNSAKSLAPAPAETLKLVTDVLLAVQPDSLVADVIEHLETHRGALANAKHINVVLEVLARSGQLSTLEELLNECKNRFHFRPSVQTWEVLLGGYASVGNEKKVVDLCQEMTEARQRLTARGYSLTIKGFLKNGMVEAAFHQIQEMQKKGFFVPSFALAQLFRTACQNNRGPEMFETYVQSMDSLQLPQDAATVLLEDCCKRDDLALSLRVEKAARDSQNPLTSGAYDALLKITVQHAHLHALELFESMQKEGIRIGEGMCVGLLARCADSKFLRFAEEIVKFVRARGSMSIACYSALMKVYAYCGMYDQACDLYTQIRAEGLEPDSMMYGCLMKFSVECGRTELSKELFDKSPSLDIQNYMSLIRAAGKDKDVKRAFTLLEKLKTSGVAVDIAAYNCVLDACVSAGDMERAHKLMQEMQTIANLDIITYNTLLKGYCSKGDVRGAKQLFQEMEQAGLAPNDISFNCLINASVSSAIPNFREAWNTIEMMERKGISVDHYTISIMMKALKKIKDPKDVGRALELLDRSGVEVCSDEILLNTVLETCTRHRQLQRLETIVDKFDCSNIRPSVHTYGSLIKACSVLKRLDRCHQLWHMMVDECGMKPNEIVLGCMLDALVCNEKVEEAVRLLNAWKNKLNPNTVMYSTIIKGFANSRQSARALDMWREMCDLHVPFNNVVYNALIDSQARVGDMDAVSEIVQSMEPHGCSPDGITYSTIVKGYCIKGDLDTAFDVFRTMQKNGMAVDSIVYNTIMDGCTRHNRMDLVDLVLEDMTTFCIKPSNFTLGILMKMYGRRHQLDKAFKVMEELPKRHGLQVNSQVKTCLMCACISNNDIDRAWKVFEEIKECGGPGDVKAFSSMLSGLVRLGHLTKAVALVEEAYGLGGCKRKLSAGSTLESEALEALVRALGQNQQMQSVGVPLLERLRAANVPISGRLFSSALHGRNN